jgi:uncharacterized protein YegL
MNNMEDIVCLRSCASGAALLWGGVTMRALPNRSGIFCRLIPAAVFGFLFLFNAPVRALGDTAAILRSVTRAAREGDLTGLEPLKNLHDNAAADTVVKMIEDKKVPDAAKQKIATVVAQWPAKSGLDYFAFYLRSHDRMGDDMLRFYAELGCAQFKPFFLGLLAPLRNLQAADIKEPARYAQALRALGRFPDQTDDAVSLIASLLDERYPHVIRADAVDALGNIKSRRGLVALISLVKDAVIGDAAQRSLFRLTGQDFGDDSKDWIAWYKEQGRQAELKMLGIDDWEKHRQQKKPAAPPPAQQNEFSARFYGVEVKARHCLFVLDCSGSMAGERISQLKLEMTNLLESLEKKPKNTRFGIITFAFEIEGCLSGRQLLPNDPANVKRAERFVEKMHAEGGTPMVAVLQLIATKVLPGSDVDTIYFMSDGEPTDGMPDDVLAVVKRIHEDFQVKFHTIGIGEAVTPANAGEKKPTLLKQMAETTGGTYTER